MRSLISVIKQHSIWLSIFIHVLLLLVLIITFHFSPKTEKYDTPNLSIPSYVYQEPAMEPAPPQTPITKQQQADPLGIERAEQAPHPNYYNTKRQTVEKSLTSEPVNLVGNKKIRKPLLELLGKAITRTILYPKMAMDFNLHGTAYIGFILQPSGLVDEVKLVKSSGAEILDRAALTGVAAISPVLGVDKFLNEKRYLVVGIIFK